MVRSPARPQSAPIDDNRILAALPDEERMALLPYLTPVSLLQRQILFDEGQEIPFIYFPHNGIVSLMVTMKEGHEAEAGVIGADGVVGSGVLLGWSRAYARNMVRISGTASRIDTRRFLSATFEGSRLRQLVLLSMGAFTAQVTRLVACNTLHSVAARSARWLLTAHDRIREDRFVLTQESFAELLGVRRATVSVVARRFQQAGLITYTRGVLQIVDRPGIETVACECYRAIQKVADETFLIFP